MCSKALRERPFTSALPRRLQKNIEGGGSAEQTRMDPKLTRVAVVPDPSPGANNITLMAVMLPAFTRTLHLAAVAVAVAMVVVAVAAVSVLSTYVEECRERCSQALFHPKTITMRPTA